MGDTGQVLQNPKYSQKSRIKGLTNQKADTSLCTVKTVG